MHILLALLGGLGAAGFLIYRLFFAYKVGKEIAEEIGDPRKIVRRHRWKRKAGADLMKDLNDPRESATILMLSMARADGDLTDRERDTIRLEMMREFEMTEDGATAMLEQMSWMTRDMMDVGPRMRRVVRPIVDRCTDRERNKLITMLITVAEAGGGMSPIKQQLLNRYRQVVRESTAER